MNTIDPLDPEATATLEPSPTIAPSRPRRSVLPRRERIIEPGVDQPTATRPPTPWTQRLVAGVLVVIALAPLTVLAFHANSSDWIPGGDRAVMELHVRDVGSHTPLLGPYSRYGWNHPGPMLYWLLAIPYRLLGSTSSALLAGTVLLNLVSIGGTLAIAWRRGRLPLLAMTALSISVLCRFVLPGTLLDPWNPFITVLPLLLFIALGWTLREGDRWAAPCLVLVGTFLVQSHVGYAGIVGLVLALVAFGWVRERWLAAKPVPADGHRHPVRRLWTASRPGVALAVSALVIGLCWAPVVVDQVRGSHNLTQVADYFVTSKDPTAGTGYALGVVTRQIVGLPLGDGKTKPPWLGGDEPVDPIGGGEVPVSTIWLALALAGFVVIGAAVRRVARRAPDQSVRLRAGGALRFQLLVGLCAAAGVVSVAHITDVVYDYLIVWWSVLAMLVWLSAAWSLWCILTPLLWRWPAVVRRARLVVGALAVVLLAWSTQVAMGDVTTASSPEPYHRDPVLALAPGTIAATPRGGPILVDSAGGGTTNMTDGLRLQLERADRPTVARSSDDYKFGSNRDATTVKPVTEVWVVSGDAIVDWAKRKDVRQVAIWDPLPSGTRAKYFEDVEVLRNQILAAHRMDIFDQLYSGGSLFEAFGLKGIDQDLLKRVDDLRGKGRPVAVFVGSAPTSPGAGAPG